MTSRPRHRPVFWHPVITARIVAGLILVLVATAIPAASSAFAAATPEPAAHDVRVPYGVVIEGVPEEDLHALLRRASQLVGLADRPPATLAGLRRRAEHDLERLATVLRSEGFYANRLAYRIDDAVTPATVYLSVDTGAVFLLEEYSERYAGPATPTAGLPTDGDDFGLHVGMWARAATIEAASRRLVDDLSNNGRPFARINDRRIVVDRNRTTMRVDVAADAGPEVEFGPVRIDGLRTIADSYIRRFVRWRRGERYDARKLEDLRRAMTQTNLFASVLVEPVQRLDVAGEVPIQIRVTEAKHRSIKVPGWQPPQARPAGSHVPHCTRETSKPPA